MSTVPRVALPDDHAGSEGTISQSKVLDHHVPTISSARATMFAALTRAQAGDPVGAELSRLTSAESTQCGLCRNVRFRAAADAGLDEDAVDRLRTGDTDDLPPRHRALVRLTEAFHAYPEDRPGVPPDVAAELGDDDLAVAGVALIKQLAFGKCLVALGIEPTDLPVTVV